MMKSIILNHHLHEEIGLANFPAPSLSSPTAPSTLSDNKTHLLVSRLNAWDLLRAVPIVVSHSEFQIFSINHLFVSREKKKKTTLYIYIYIHIQKSN